MQFLQEGIEASKPRISFAHQSSGIVEKLLLPKSLIEMLAQLWYKLLDTPIEEMQVLESKVYHCVQEGCVTELFNQVSEQGKMIRLE